MRSVYLRANQVKFVFKANTFPATFSGYRCREYLIKPTQVNGITKADFTIAKSVSDLILKCIKSFMNFKKTTSKKGNRKSKRKTPFISDLICKDIKKLYWFIVMLII